MRIAIIYDYLPGIGGGAERVLTDIIAATYPNCDLFLGGVVYTDFSRSWLNNIQTQFPEVKITITRHINYFQGINLRLLHYELPQIMQSCKRNNYDIVLCYTSFLAHTAIRPLNGRKIIYMNTPARILWHLPHSNSGIKKIIPQWLMLMIQSPLRVFDISYMYSADTVLAISQHVKDRITSFYNKDSDIVYPAVEVVAADEETDPRMEFGKYFLHISRIESYKNIQTLIDTIAAFPDLTDTFVIAGNGPYYDSLLKYAEKKLSIPHRKAYSPTLEQRVFIVKNIVFTQFVPEEKKAALLSHAQASFSLNDEDFGITKIESLAYGTPVIALAKGAAPEIITHTLHGILYQQNTVQSLYNAIMECKNTEFKKEILQEKAAQFSFGTFKKQIRTYLGL